MATTNATSASARSPLAAKVPRRPVGHLLRDLLIAMVGMLSICSAATAALAQGHCIECNGPEAVYECQIAAVDGTPRPATLQTQIQCLKSLAKTGGHASCAMRRASNMACLGAPVLLNEAALTGPTAGGGALGTGVAPDTEAGFPPDLNDPQPVPAADASDRPDRSEPPKTLVEATERAVDQSREQINQMQEVLSETGESVSKGVKSTWECVTSLFTNC